MIRAPAAGEIDIADLTYPTLPIAIQNAGMGDLRVIADEFQGGNPSYYSNEYFVLADLKGKAVDVNAPYSRSRKSWSRSSGASVCRLAAYPAQSQSATLMNTNCPLIRGRRDHMCLEMHARGVGFPYFIGE